MTILAVSVFCGLVVGVVISIEVGFVIGRRRWSRRPAEARHLHPSMEASIFGLMGLLIAFIFYGAGSRYDIRRNLMVLESNAIGTAYLRLDLLPPDAQPQLREDFRAYVRSRLLIFKMALDSKEREDELHRSAVLQGRIWSGAVEAVARTRPSTETLVISSLNEVIDITTTQSTARLAHPPLAVFVMLAIAVLGSSVLAGYSMSIVGVRDRIFVTVYAILLSVSVYVILDYEFPRVGLIRVDKFDQMLEDNLARMK